MRKVKINFHGFLKKLIPNEIEGSFNTLHDILMFLSANYPQLKAPLDVGRYKVKIAGYNSKESIYCNLHSDNVDIFPCTEMAKSAGFGQIIIGSVLVIVGALVAAFVPGGQGAGIWMMEKGAIMIAMGILTFLLTPKIKDKSDGGSSNNKYLGSPLNTTASGTPIPIGYGLFKVHGHYISFNISSSSLVIVGSK